jgi:hypothetical protein
LHPMQTRSKSGINKQKAFLASIRDSSMVDMSLIEPTTYKFVIKAPVWLQAMQDEIHALHTQGTWSLVPLPAKRNLVGCKWIFKIKRHSDGSIVTLHLTSKILSALGLPVHPNPRLPPRSPSRVCSWQPRMAPKHVLLVKVSMLL